MIWKINSISSKLKTLEAAQKKGNFKKVAKQYFKIGKAYKKQGNIEKAIYYLERFDSVVGGDNDLYDKFAKKDDLATEWISELQIEHPPITERIRKEVDKTAKTLNIIQLAQWNLLTLARCTILFHKFSMIPAFGVLAQYETVLNMLTKGIYGHQEAVDEDLLFSFTDELGDIFNSFDSMNNHHKVSIDGGADFVVTDLESNSGTYNLTTILEDLSELAAGADVDELSCNFVFHRYHSEYQQYDDDDDLSYNFVPNGLFADYYIRTQNTSIEHNQWIQQEKERIWSDFEFVKNEPTEDAFAERMAAYMKLSLPQV